MTVPTIRQRRTPPDGLGQALREAREAVGLSQAATAQACGIGQSYLAKLEDSSRCPSVTVADRLAEVLQLGDLARALLAAAAVDDAGRSHPARTHTGS